MNEGIPAHTLNSFIVLFWGGNGGYLIDPIRGMITNKQTELLEMKICQVMFGIHQYNVVLTH